MNELINQLNYFFGDKSVEINLIGPAEINIVLKDCLATCCSKVLHVLAPFKCNDTSIVIGSCCFGSRARALGDGDTDFWCKNFLLRFLKRSQKRPRSPALRRPLHTSFLQLLMICSKTMPNISLATLSAHISRALTPGCLHLAFMSAQGKVA